MTISIQHGHVRYTGLDAKDSDEVAELVASVFTDGSEPLTRTLGVGPEAFAHFVKLILPKCLNEGISIVARDSETGEVVGAQLNDDAGTEMPDMARVQEWLAPVLALLEELDCRYFRGQAVVPGYCAHFFLTAVSDKHRGRGIASRLLELSMSHACSKGYKVAIAEATGLVSQNILREAGFEPGVEIPYPDFQYDGYRPFEAVKDHPSAILMHRQLKH